MRGMDGVVGGNPKNSLVFNFNYINRGYWEKIGVVDIYRITPNRITRIKLRGKFTNTHFS